MLLPPGSHEITIEAFGVAFPQNGIGALRCNTIAFAKMRGILNCENALCNDEMNIATNNIFFMCGDVTDMFRTVL